MHTEDSSHALLSAKNRRPQQVVSICGQCHLRGGISESSGLPYPNTFVPGDNLFLDFDVDLAETAISSHSALEQHIFLNSRDIAALGETKVDCLSCHDVHAGSTEKHENLRDSKLCSSCHLPGADKSQLHASISLENTLQQHSHVCDY
jgi:predicted CXXCH cytochrome family protein